MAAATFTVDLQARKTDIKTWFRTANDEILGAYYRTVRRVK